MTGMHKKGLPFAQLSIISHSADAYGGFSSQFHRIGCSPLEVFDLHTYKGPGFPVALFFCPADTASQQKLYGAWQACTKKH
jgi:hypothetical protein